MKAVILAGGYGSRLSEETVNKPKPLVQIGGYPILWHIMKIYSHYGIHEFIVCLGYKGNMIKEYFTNYFLQQSDITIDMKENKIVTYTKYCEPWKVTLVDTGKDTLTGGRLKRVQRYIGDETFCFTYGDGLSDINIDKVIKFHKSEGTIATLTAIQMPSRYGVLTLDQNKVCNFQEKPKDKDWINGGFFILEPEIFDYIDGDSTILEKEPLEALVSKRQISAFKHEGFWASMDTLKDKQRLEELWELEQSPWKVW